MRQLSLQSGLVAAVGDAWRCADGINAIDAIVPLLDRQHDDDHSLELTQCVEKICMPSGLMPYSSYRNCE
jgi:hypothetical protein